MKSLSIRHARDRFSALVRTAAQEGEITIITAHGKPAAMIAPVQDEPGQEKRTEHSDPLAFKQALLSLPHKLDF